MSQVCPRCEVPTIVRLKPGEVCPTCQSELAWSEQEHIVIRKREVEDAVAVRERGVGALEPLSRKVTRICLALITFAIAMAGLVFAIRLLSRWDVGPLDELLDALQLHSLAAFGLGVVGLSLAFVGHFRLRRTHLFRSWPLVAIHLLAATAGLGGSCIGMLTLQCDSDALGLDHLSIPPRSEELGLLSPTVSAVMDATTVIISPGQDGNAAMPALGSGAIIATHGDRAWVVTCSHVAMPYWAVGAWRDVREAHSVWVYLSDGRNTRGTIRWAARPPLDVALVEVNIEAPPAPVTVATDSAYLEPESEVQFVPNPFRNGWLSHRGEITKRVTHNTPAGAYSLLYTDLPVLQGDSGSGLFDTNGRLVGLNTWNRIGWGGPQGISLPSETMRAIVEVLESGDFARLDEIARIHSGRDVR